MFTNREEIVALLTELGARLDARGLEIEVYIVGGAAMLLGFDRLAVTRDIDALIAPPGVVDDVVAQMATDHGNLPPDWLNDRVVPLLPRIADAGRWEVLNIPGITVQVASPQHLLAMKLRAARGIRDLQDVAVLCDVMNLATLGEVWDIAHHVWGAELIPAEVKATVNEYLLTRGLRD